MRFLPKLILLDSKNSIAWIFSAISWLCFGKNDNFFDIMTVFCILLKQQVYLSFVRSGNKTGIGPNVQISVLRLGVLARHSILSC